MYTKKDLTAIILAGGKSTRMKQDKGLTYLQDTMLVEAVLEKVKKISSTILLITAHPGYLQFGFPCIADVYSNKGPLAAIYAGLLHSKTSLNLVMACDTPFVSEHLLNGLLDAYSNEDVLYSEHLGKPEPLCAIYNKSCANHLKNRIEADVLKITDAIQGLQIRPISFDTEPWFTANEFANINTPEEILKYKKI